MNRARTVVVGCGRVSETYLKDLTRSRFVDLVAVCDLHVERAARRAGQFGVATYADRIEALVARVPFDLLINLTDIPSHGAVTRLALEAGKHVLSERPLATTRQESDALIALAKAQGVRLCVTPNALVSPQFRFLAQYVGSGALGTVVQAHGAYGQGGPSYGPWFDPQGVGTAFERGIYQITFLTGLFGPACAVSALSNAALPIGTIEGDRVRSEGEESAMVLIEHPHGVFSTLAIGFTFGRYRLLRILGTAGSAHVLGWDWLPEGIGLWREEEARWVTVCTDRQDYGWQTSGSYVAQCLATGVAPVMDAEHACHALDVFIATRESATSGRRVEVSSRFPWPQEIAGADAIATAAAVGSSWR